jgi:amidase
MDELLFRSAGDLARAIRDRKASAGEVLEAHLRQIGAHNGPLNAVVTLDEAGARRRAREANDALARGELWGPLHGVPITVKDCFETAGLRTTCGFPPLKNHVPTEDATAVARLRAAGAVVMGKTNTAIFTADYQTDNPIFGRTNNPWDPSRTAGGSSGGSASAVAAGLSPLDLASDIAGSIRVPSHFCGIYGLKPTEHRVSSVGHIPDWYVPGMTPRGIVRHMGTYGPLARSVDDLQLALSLIAGPDPRRPEVPPAATGEGPAPRPRLAGLRFAWTDRFGDLEADADTRDTLRRVAVELEGEGAHVERIEPDIDFDRLWLAGGEIAGAEMAGPAPFLLRTMLRLKFRLMADRSPIRRGFIRGPGLNAAGLLRALEQRDEAVRRMDEVFDDFDAWLCPVTATPAFSHRKTGRPIEVDGQPVSYFLAAGGFASTFNVSGNPVVVIPAGRSRDGLPIGLQVVGRRWADERLLAIAASLDALVGDFRDPPGRGAPDRTPELEPSIWSHPHLSPFQEATMKSIPTFSAPLAGLVVLGLTACEPSNPTALEPDAALSSRAEAVHGDIGTVTVPLSLTFSATFTVPGASALEHCPDLVDPQTGERFTAVGSGGGHGSHVGKFNFTRLEHPTINLCSLLLGVDPDPMEDLRREGEFALMAADGSTLAGTYAFLYIPPHLGGFFTLFIESGTRRFEGASGELHLDWDRSGELSCGDDPLTLCLAEATLDPAVFRGTLRLPQPRGE